MRLPDHRLPQGHVTENAVTRVTGPGDCKWIDDCWIGSVSMMALPSEGWCWFYLLKCGCRIFWQHDWNKLTMYLHLWLAWRYMVILRNNSAHVRTYVCACVCAMLLHMKYQNLHSTTKMRTFWGGKKFFLSFKSTEVSNLCYFFK